MDPLEAERVQYLSAEYSSALVQIIKVLQQRRMLIMNLESIRSSCYDFLLNKQEKHLKCPTCSWKKLEKKTNYKRKEEKNMRGHPAWKHVNTYIQDRMSINILINGMPPNEKQNQNRKFAGWIEVGMQEFLIKYSKQANNTDWGSNPLPSWITILNFTPRLRG